MKKTKVNFSAQLNNVQIEAVKHIKKLVKKHKEIKFYEEPVGDEEDMLYDTPRFTFITPHNEYISMGITKLVLANDGSVNVFAKDTDLDEDEGTFTLADLNTEDTIYLADQCESNISK